MERPAGKIRTLNGEVMWHIFSLLVEHFFLILLFQLFSKLEENSGFLISQRSRYESDTVFDPFVGVGSSLIAAILHDRKGIVLTKKKCILT
jgi:hypothetical protein